MDVQEMAVMIGMLRVCRVCEKEIETDVFYSVPQFGEGETSYSHYHEDCYLSREQFKLEFDELPNDGGDDDGEVLQAAVESEENDGQSEG